MRRFCQIQKEHLAPIVGLKENFPFDHYIINGYRNGDTNAINQGK